MKTTLITLIGLTALIASAQNTPFVYRSELKTNVTKVPAHDVVAAHTITAVARIAYVAEFNEKNNLVPHEQPSMHIVSVVTNLVDGKAALVQKPLLSAQRPPRPTVKGTNAPPTKPRPVVPAKTNAPSTFRQTVK